METLDILSFNEEELDKNVENIKERANKKALLETEPTINEIMAVTKIILDFVKEKKRKLYGGYAQHLLLKNKGSEIYTETELKIADIDFYSPYPLKDLKELCDILDDAGYESVEGKEAQHVETYKIYVNYKDYCDISYVPINVYKNIRFIEVDGYVVSHPWFIMIDMFRQFTDLLVSNRTLSKALKRFKKLQEYYPLPLIKQKLVIDSPKTEIKNILKIIFENFLVLQPTLIFTGIYVYDYYNYYSGCVQSYVNIPYYEIYSTNYVNDGLNIIDYFKNSEYAENIMYEEHYPLFQYLGHYTVFYYIENKIKKPILFLFSNNKRCIPYKTDKAILFENDNQKILDKNINLGSFDFNILHLLMMTLKYRIENDNDMNDTIYKTLNGYINFRNCYLENNKLTIFDDSIYQSFVVDCIGKTIQSARDRYIRGAIRKKLGKPPVYKYSPKESRHDIKYKFSNSSGNKILNKSHYKLVEEKRIYNDVADIEDEEKNVDENDNINDNILEITTNEKYFEDIKNKQKTIEIKINKGVYANLKKNNIIIFKNKEETIKTKITKINRYDNFKDLLTNENINKIDTDIIMNDDNNDNNTKIQDIIDALRTVYTEKDEKDNGVIAIHFIVIK